jgi:hypothetical protein
MKFQVTVQLMGGSGVKLTGITVGAAVKVMLPLRVVPLVGKGTNAGVNGGTRKFGIFDVPQTPKLCEEEPLTVIVKGLKLSSAPKAYPHAPGREANESPAPIPKKPDTLVPLTATSYVFVIGFGFPGFAAGVSVYWSLMLIVAFSGPEYLRGSVGETVMTGPNWID